MISKSTSEIKFLVEEFENKQPWNHNFTLPGNIETRAGDFKSPAKNYNKLKRLEEVFAAIDLNNKMVLDIGCNEGFFTLEMANRGATVTGLDVDEVRLEKAEFIRALLSPTNSINFLCKNFLSDDVNVGCADVVLCLGFLHRVPDPISAISKLATMGNILIFEWKAHPTGTPNYPSAVFTQQPINQADNYGTEYWLPSVDAVKAILSRYGFNKTYLLKNPGSKREIIVASKIELSGITVQSELYRVMYSIFLMIKLSIKEFYLAFKNKK